MAPLTRKEGARKAAEYDAQLDGIPRNQYALLSDIGVSLATLNKSKRNATTSEVSNDLITSSVSSPVPEEDGKRRKLVQGTRSDHGTGNEIPLSKARKDGKTTTNTKQDRNKESRAKVKAIVKRRHTLVDAPKRPTHPQPATPAVSNAPTICSLVYDKGFYKAHVLDCGHIIETPFVEPCGPNCKTDHNATGTWKPIPFFPTRTHERFHCAECTASGFESKQHGRETEPYWIFNIPGNTRNDKKRLSCERLAFAKSIKFIRGRMFELPTLGFETIQDMWEQQMSKPPVSEAAPSKIDWYMELKKENCLAEAGEGITWLVLWAVVSDPKAYTFALPGDAGCVLDELLDGLSMLKPYAEQEKDVADISKARDEVEVLTGAFRDVAI